MPALLVWDLGLVPYDAAWDLQRRAVQARRTGELAEDLLLLVEHPPVVTLGRGTKPGHLLAPATLLESQGIQLREVERGGDVTIHEPGQLVAYPIIDLKQHRQDLHWYLRQLEEAIIRAIAAFGLEGSRVPGLTGVWHARADGTRVKLASIGVHARDWVTWHGLALNVCNTLATFAHTVPCGIDGVVMSTVEAELGAAAPPATRLAPAVRYQLITAVGAVFALTPTPLPTSLDRLLSEL